MVLFRFTKLRKLVFLCVSLLLPLFLLLVFLLPVVLYTAVMAADYFIFGVPLIIAKYLGFDKFIVEGSHAFSLFGWVYLVLLYPLLAFFISWPFNLIKSIK